MPVSILGLYYLSNFIAIIPFVLKPCYKQGAWRSVLVACILPSSLFLFGFVLIFRPEDEAIWTWINFPMILEVPILVMTKTLSPESVVIVLT